MALKALQTGHSTAPMLRMKTKPSLSCVSNVSNKTLKPAPYIAYALVVVALSRLNHTKFRSATNKDEYNLLWISCKIYQRLLGNDGRQVNPIHHAFVVCRHSYNYCHHPQYHHCREQDPPLRIPVVSRHFLILRQYLASRLASPLCTLRSI